MKGLREVLELLRLNLTAIPRRPRHALLALAGFFIATAALIALLAIPRAIDRAASVTGSNDVVLMIARAQNILMGGSLPAADADIASDLPDVADVASELLVTVKLRRADGTQTNVIVRGITAAVLNSASPQISIVNGRFPAPGSNQIMVGWEAAQTFPQLIVGGQIRLANKLWRVSGIFKSGGSLWESELWAPLDTLQSAVNAQGRISAVLIQLNNPDDFASLKQVVARDPRLDVRLVRERDYYLRQVWFLVHFATIGAWCVAVLLGFAALAAVVNAVTLSLLARGGELALLRALGFVRGRVAAALIGEVLLTAIIGTGLAALVCWPVLDHFRIITRSSSGHVITLALSLDPVLIGQALAYALIIGFLSALGPCTYAATRHMVDGLSEI